MAQEEALQKFSGGDVLLCPVCRGKLLLKKRNLVCKERHSFDVAGHGYVNLLAGHRSKSGYSKALYRARRAVYEAGIYRDFEQALAEMAAPRLAGPAPRLLDCGCGEGWFLHRLVQGLPAGETVDAYGVDIEKEAVAMAASLDRQVKWLVGDLQAMPLRKNRFDLVLDILTPANYAEFGRLLRKGGAVLKVTPGEEYLREVRRALGHGAYSGEPVREYAGRMFRVLKEQRVQYTCTGLGEEIQRQIGRMSPLGFHADESAFPREALDSITIDLRLMLMEP